MLPLADSVRNLTWDLILTDSNKKIIAHFCVAAAQKASIFGHYYFSLIKNVGNSGLGLKDFVKAVEKKPRKVHDDSKVQEVSLKLFDERWKHAKEHLIRTAFNLGAGVCGTLEALHRHEKVTIGWGFQVITKMSSLFIISANLLTLEKCITQYNESTAALNTLKDEQFEAAIHARDSSILGILSSLNYIFACSIALMGWATTIAMIIGIVGTSTGFVKTLHDYYHTQEPEVRSQKTEDRSQ